MDQRRELAAICALLLTGFWRMEVVGMRKAWIDADGNAVAFPDTRLGPQTRVSGDTAIACLVRQSRDSASPFVFPADWGDGHFVGVVRLLDRVCRRAGLTAVTPPVLRHTFAGLAASLGSTELTIAGLLGHASQRITQRYVHLDAVPLIAADQVAAEIARLLDGGEGTSPHGAKQGRQDTSFRLADHKVDLADGGIEPD